MRSSVHPPLKQLSIDQGVFNCCGMLYMPGVPNYDHTNCSVHISHLSLTLQCRSSNLRTTPSRSTHYHNFTTSVITYIGSKLVFTFTPAYLSTHYWSLSCISNPGLLSLGQCKSLENLHWLDLCSSHVCPS